MKTRRRVLQGLTAAVGAVALGGALYRFTDIFAKHYPPTPYDDMLARLKDRPQAARFGAAALKAMPGFDLAKTAARLRASFGAGGLSVAATIDTVNGRLIEADGWIVPECVALLSALAAKV